LGVDKNKSTSLKLFRKAAEQGYAYAQCMLGGMYENGRGIDKNKSTAVKWFRKAVDQEYADA